MSSLGHAQWRSREPVRVSVVTPVLNSDSLIGGTVRSVVTQSAVLSGRAHLDYVVADGGSTDDTVATAEAAADGRALVRSATDEGMYDALAKTWDERVGSAELVAYLNAGDLWHPTALDVVLDVMEATGALWVCGYRTVYNDRGQTTYVALPFRYRRRLIRRSIYGTTLPHIQQESTFWSGSLMDTVDLEVLRRLRLAGDHYLWACFASRTEPTVIASILGGFRIHEAQLSTAGEAYHAEMRLVSGRPGIADRLVAALDWPVWRMPDIVKKKLNPNHLVRYDHDAQSWC